MSDCSEIEIREQLPEYLHGTLTSEARARMAAHLASCEECAAELRLAEGVKRTYSTAAPRIDIGAIVRALPSPPAARPSLVDARADSGTRRRRAVLPRRWALRAAAVISFVSIGGISLLVARSYSERDRGSDGAARGGDSALVTASSRATSGAAVESASASTSAREGLTVAGGVADLETDELELLIGALDGIDATPAADPDEAIGAVPTSTSPRETMK